MAKTIVTINTVLNNKDGRVTTLRTFGLSRITSLKLTNKAKDIYTSKPGHSYAHGVNTLLRKFFFVLGSKHNAEVQRNPRNC